MNSQVQPILFKRLLLPFCIFVCAIILYIPSNAQEQPPKPISVKVSTLQHLSFGTFIQGGNNGTVTVTNQGVRTSSGSIILPNMSSIVTPALFEVDAIPGTLINIYSPDSQLSGNGGTLDLKVGEPNTGSPFITTSEHTNVFIGGTLIVGSLIANPAGDYFGTFSVTFIQE